MNMLKRYSTTLCCAGAFLAAAVLAGCGGGSQGRDPILGLPAAEFVSVTVTPAVATVAVGGTQAYVATANYADGSSRDVSATSAWVSATPAVASVVAGTGLAKGLSAGGAAISAAFNGKTGAATLTVSPPVVVPPPVVVLAGLAITPVNPSIKIGASQQLLVIANYSDLSTQVVTGQTAFSSASPLVAGVGPTSGIATGLTAGTSVVSAAFGGMSASTTVTVPALLLSSIAVTPATSTVAIGGTQRFVATATYSDNSTADVSNTVTWSAGSTTIGTVASGGVATGLAAGVTPITATSGATQGSASLTVSAALPPPPVPAATVNLGTAASFGVLAGTSITNNSGGTTLVTGDVGSPSQTTDPVQAAGFNNYKSGAILAGALADLQVAITDANSRTCDVTSAAGIDLGGLTLPPGVYCYTGAINITGTFTMSAPGLYIFRTASTLNSTANSIVALTGGATAANVFWVPVGPTTLGANSVFKGSVLGQSAAITMGDNASLQNGRVLSGAAVTLRNNVISK